MQVGNIVKSLDFNGIDNCYMIGKVVGVHFDGTFRARLIKRVWQGTEYKRPKIDYFTAPLQGNQMFDQPKTPRVIVIG